MVHIYFSHPDYKGRYVKKVLGITLLISIVATCIAAAGEPPPPTTIEECGARGSAGRHPDNRFLTTLKNAVRDEFRGVDGLILGLRDGSGGAWWLYLDPFFADRDDYFIAQISTVEFAAPAKQKCACGTC